MQVGKSKSSQKTREPYGKVTEVGQVPIALKEISELTHHARQLKAPEIAMDALFLGLGRIQFLIDSVIAVTCANPGCLSQMAENMEVKS